MVTADTRDEQEHVIRVLYQVRLRNAVAVAWIRVVACVLGLMVYLSAWALGREPIAQVPGRAAVISLAHVAIGIGLLRWLLRRPSGSVILAGAVVDLVSVSLLAFFASHASPRPAESVVLYTAAVQLLLLLDSLTVEWRPLTGLAASSWALVAILAAYRRLPPFDAALALLILGAFGVTIALAASRLIGLAAREAEQEWTAVGAERHARELAKVNAALRTTEARKRELTSLIVHDLRNPLVSIWATLDELRNGLPAPDPGHTTIDEAIGELRRINAMTGDLLIAARLEDESTHDATVVRVDELLSDVERGLGPVVRKSGALLELRRASDASPTVRVDPSLVRRMLDNLVGNAARHVGPGDRVEVAAEPDGDRLRLAVRNSGPPVPAEVRDRLFEKHATTGLRGGHHVGLGLYMCRLVAERHGGSIALVERLGWNVSFEVTLPAG